MLSGLVQALYVHLCLTGRSKYGDTLHHTEDNQKRKGIT